MNDTTELIAIPPEWLAKIDEMRSYYPTNYSAILVLADWLDEHGDPRAECLRWAAQMERRPIREQDGWRWFVSLTADVRNCPEQFLSHYFVRAIKAGSLYYTPKRPTPSGAWLDLMGAWVKLDRDAKQRLWEEDGDMNEAAFLRTIIGHPNETGPRQVFADWLQEQGDPWGEFIAEQLRLADSEDYEQAYTKTRGGFPNYSNETKKVIERCRRFLDTHTGSLVQRCLSAFWRGKGAGEGWRPLIREWRPKYGDLIWWREIEGVPPERMVDLFVWRGLPERAEVRTAYWMDWHHEMMGAFPLWYVRVNKRDNPGPSEEFLRSFEQYAGRLTTLDMPYWMTINGFTAWVQAWMDRVGEKCHAATGQPFTLKIGQAIMGGPPHSVQDRWMRVCESLLKNSNVLVVSRLEARSAGNA